MKKGVRGGWGIRFDLVVVMSASTTPSQSRFIAAGGQLLVAIAIAIAIAVACHIAYADFDLCSAQIRTFKAVLRHCGALAAVPPSSHLYSFFCGPTKSWATN